MIIALAHSLENVFVRRLLSQRILWLGTAAGFRRRRCDGDSFNAPGKGDNGRAVRKRRVQEFVMRLATGLSTTITVQI